MRDVLMTQKKIENIERITAKAREMGVVKPEAIQYILATVMHETNKTFEPVKEAYWTSEQYKKENFRYYPYYGRGFVQLTHKENYEKFSKIMNIDLVNNPDLALDFDNALFILIYGMIHGSFTKAKLSDYFNHKGSNFIGARKIINGIDKEETIARIAQGVEL